MHEKQLRIAWIEVVDPATEVETEFAEQRPHRGVGAIGRGPDIGAGREAEGMVNEGRGDAASAMRLGDDDELDKGLVQDFGYGEAAGEGAVAQRDVAGALLHPVADIGVTVAAGRGERIDGVQQLEIARLSGTNLKH